mgnify:FL=1|tara:strand:+ start:87 stop:1073 length:987 start_codon:yes stop_codon:yes gene_type:complete
MSLTLSSIKAAEKRLSGVAVNTPLVTNHYMNDRLNAKVYFKLENCQHIGAFKFRGAYNRLTQLDHAQRKLGVVAFSSGNHAQGIALAANMLGMQATIVMPKDAPQLKLEGTLRLGAKVVEYDRKQESREEIAGNIADETGATLVPAFEDFDVMAGQGTAGLEIVKQLNSKREELDTFLSPCGGGGLLAGTSTAIRGSLPSVRIYGVEQEQYDDHARSKVAGRRVQIEVNTPTMCDALMATIPGEMTWSVNCETVDDFLVVSEDSVAFAVAFAFRHLKLVLEPGGAVGLAALLDKRIDISGKTVAVILSGGNIDNETFNYCQSKYPNPE